MIKNLLIKCCSLIGRDDLVDELKNANSITEIVKNNAKIEILKLISYFNFIMSTIFETYLRLEYCEKMTSDSACEIDFDILTFTPIEIVKVEDITNTPAEYKIKPNCLLTNKANHEFFVTYRYVPLKIHDLNESYLLPKLMNDKMICYGVVSEFLASKGKFQESEFFSDKFMYEIFKLKTNKEKKLRKTFCL